MNPPIKHFQFWLHSAEFAALKRMRQYPGYIKTALAHNDCAHTVNVIQRLLDAYAGVPIGPACPSGVTEAVDSRNADPASDNPT